MYMILLLLLLEYKYILGFRVYIYIRYRCVFIYMGVCTIGLYNALSSPREA